MWLWIFSCYGSSWVPSILILHRYLSATSIEWLDDETFPGSLLPAEKERQTQEFKCFACFCNLIASNCSSYLLILLQYHVSYAVYFLIFLHWAGSWNLYWMRVSKMWFFFLKEHQRVINSLVIPFWFLRGTGIFFFWGHESNGGLLKCGHQGLPRKICTFSSFKDATLGTIIHRLCLSVWSVWEILSFCHQHCLL